MKTPMVVGYRHTGIICKDIEASLIFYRDVLGLEVIQDFWDATDYINKITGLEGANVHMIKLKAQDGTVLEILEYEGFPTELIPQPIYNVGAAHIALQVGDAEEAHTELVDLGYEVLSEPVVSSEGIAKVFFCLDPNQVRIELVEMLTRSN